MEWQEIVFTLGSLIFIVALIPSVLERKPPALSTSVTTGLVLALFSLTYMTMEFYFAGATSLITAALWFTLAYQRVSQVVQ